LVLTLNSQPSSLVPTAGVVQLAKPESHVDVHTDATQLRDAVFVPEHVRPQAPQLKTSSLVTVSHPSSATGATGLMQLPNPVRQVGAQTPIVQAVLTELTPEQM
jgi:predicted secreted protein